MERAVLDVDLPGRLYQHRQRLWRVAINVREHAMANHDDDRLLHLMSRVGVFIRGVSSDLRAGIVSTEEATELLDLLAQLGDMHFEQWRTSNGREAMD